MEKFRHVKFEDEWQEELFQWLLKNAGPALEAALDEASAKAYAEGKIEKSKELAFKMHEAGKPVEEIASFLGYSVEMVNQWIKSADSAPV